jgi:hypothetical protein
MPLLQRKENLHEIAGGRRSSPTKLGFGAPRHCRRKALGLIDLGVGSVHGHLSRTGEDKAGHLTDEVAARHNQRGRNSRCCLRLPETSIPHQRVLLLNEVRYVTPAAYFNAKRARAARQHGFGGLLIHRAATPLRLLLFVRPDKNQAGKVASILGAPDVRDGSAFLGELVHPPTRGVGEDRARLVGD